MALLTRLQEDEGSILLRVSPSCLAVLLRDLYLTNELKRRLNSFGTLALRQILGYRLQDYVQ